MEENIKKDNKTYFTYKIDFLFFIPFILSFLLLLFGLYEIFFNKIILNNYNQYILYFNFIPLLFILSKQFDIESESGNYIDKELYISSIYNYIFYEIIKFIYQIINILFFGYLLKLIYNLLINLGFTIVSIIITLLLLIIIFNQLKIHK